MNYRKILSPLIAAAALLLLVAATASATTVTSPQGTVSTPTIKATSTGVSLHGSFITVSCAHSALEGKVESHGAAVTAALVITTWTYSECNYPVTVISGGSIQKHYTAGSNGRITSIKKRWAVHTSVGECVFETNGTDLGTLIGGTGAKLAIESAAIPRTGGSFFCGSSGTLTGSYTVTSPSHLSLH